MVLARENDADPWRIYKIEGGKAVRPRVLKTIDLGKTGVIKIPTIRLGGKLLGIEAIEEPRLHYILKQGGVVTPELQSYLTTSNLTLVRVVYGKFGGAVSSHLKRDYISEKPAEGNFITSWLPYKRGKIDFLVSELSAGRIPQGKMTSYHLPRYCRVPKEAKNGSVHDVEIWITTSSSLAKQARTYHSLAAMDQVYGFDRSGQPLENVVRFRLKARKDGYESYTFF